MAISFWRTVLIYLVLILVVRLLGKRQIGQMEPSEFVVTMLVANLASIPMENVDMPLRSGLIPILTVLALEVLLSLLSLRSVRLRRVLCGKPVILIENGKILQNNLRKTRVTLDELTGHLREKDVLDIGSVQFAILETNGNLSVFPFPKDRPASAEEAGIAAKDQHMPVTIIGDGWLYRENLKRAGKDIRWLEKTLKERNATEENTWLLTVDEANRVFWLPKEKKRRKKR